MKSLAYFLLGVYIFLSLSGFIFGCELGFGYGLGDIAYYFTLWPIAILYSIYLFVFFEENKTLKQKAAFLIFILIALFYIYSMTLGRGVECPWSFSL